MVWKALCCFGIALLTSALISAAQRPAGDAGQLALEELNPGDAHQLTSEWLEQRDPRLLAWAAFWIERDAQTERVPQLLDLAS
jgi:hypothetical protein